MTRSEAEALDTLPALPRDGDGPVFAAPWQAQAFALAVSLNERGVFSWSEWAEHLGTALHETPEETPGPDAYYLAWLAALERLLATKGVVGDAERDIRARAWERAAHATPHGQPIVLERP